MGDNIKNYPQVIEGLLRFDDDHPYLIAFFLSATIISCALFCTRNSQVYFDDQAKPDRLSFVDVETIQPQKQVAVQDITSTDGEVVPVKKVSRATGTSNREDAVDIDMMGGSNIVHPKVIGTLPDLYPSLGRDEGVEAIVMTELTISADGIIQRVKVKNVRLLKDVSDEIKAQLKKDFAVEVQNIFKGARFTPAVIDGEKKAVIMTIPLNFKLNQ